MLEIQSRKRFSLLDVFLSSKRKIFLQNPQQVYTCVPWPKLGHMQGSLGKQESRIFSFYVGRWRLWHHQGVYTAHQCPAIKHHPSPNSLCKLLHLLSSLYLVMTPAIFLSLLWRPPILWGSFLSLIPVTNQSPCLKDHPSLHRESSNSFLLFVLILRCLSLHSKTKVQKL